jgi:hypothetical protein
MVVRLQGEYEDISESFKESLDKPMSLVFCELERMSDDNAVEIFQAAKSLMKRNKDA